MVFIYIRQQPILTHDFRLLVCGKPGLGMLLHVGE